MYLALKIALSLAGLAGLSWWFWWSLRRSEDPAKILFKEILSIVLVVSAVFYIRSTITHLGGGLAADFVPAMVIACTIAACGVILSILWTPQISSFLFSPLTNLFDGGNLPPEPKPVYSMALAKRKAGKPLEAVLLIREQLAKFPEDFEGVMLLAHVQADDLNDLHGAEITFNHYCLSPRALEKQVVAAMTQLADWHLKLGADVDAARAALQTIIRRFPETEAALRAEQRLAHFDETEKILLARHDRQTVTVPEGVKNIGLLDSTDFLKPKEIEPGKLAAVYLKQLEQHPHDAEAREKLAILYAREYKRLDLATMELNQLISEPRFPAKQTAKWLNLLASFQVELGGTVEEVTATLEKIVTDFPDSPVAEQAERRLARIKLEFHAKKETPGVKLGVYEQNVGLKYGSPRKL